MGGCTITKIAENKTWLLAEMERQILAAAEMGLYPDSELIVLGPGAKAAELYKCHLDYVKKVDQDPEYVVTFEEVEKGRGFHVGVAATFGPKPGPGEWVATVHVHS